MEYDAFNLIRDCKTDLDGAHLTHNLPIITLHA